MPSIILTKDSTKLYPPSLWERMYHCARVLWHTNIVTRLFEQTELHLNSLASGKLLELVNPTNLLRTQRLIETRITNIYPKVSVE